VGTGANRSGEVKEDEGDDEEEPDRHRDRPGPAGRAGSRFGFGIGAPIVLGIAFGESVAHRRRSYGAHEPPTTAAGRDFTVLDPRTGLRETCSPIIEMRFPGAMRAGTLGSL
jgi:hypothetical protein